MINNFFYFLIVTVLLLGKAYCENKDFTFETQTIEITNNGNLVNANDGKVFSKNGEFEITAQNFQYYNDTKILQINRNGLFVLKNKNLKIKFEQGLFDQKKNLLEAIGKVEIINQNRNLIIKSKKIKYDLKNQIIYSNTESIINDNFKNKLITEKFNYRVQKDIIKIEGLKLEDKNQNTLNLSLAFLNIKTNNLIGKDIFLELKNQKTVNENEPRLKGISLVNDDNYTKISKGVFTTCKRTGNCPAWQLSAKKIEHDKKRKKINYEDAVLKVKNLPIIYFPSFSHPDPTVDRQSGFLVPSIKNTFNKKNYINLPYYLVISDNKDATFSPRFYNDEQFLLHTEYRGVNFKSKILSDLSFKIDDFNKIKSHIFYRYNKFFNFNNFIDSKFEFNVQKTSKDTYLKKNKIKSDLVLDNNILENSLKFEFSENNTLINFETISYENLNKEENDRYEYILPRFSFQKAFDNNDILNGNFIFTSNFTNKNYNTNIFETINSNNLMFESNPKINKNGIYTNYNLLLKNSNINAKNSTTYKNKETALLTGLFQLDASFPLIKDHIKYNETLNPKLALKISPNHTKDNRKKDERIDITNIYSLERNSGEDYVESGVSLTYGNKYSLVNKKNSLDLFSFEIANNLRINENEDLPRNSQLDETISSIFNEITFQPIENFNLNYKSSIKNNLKSTNYENLSSTMKINNLITSFEFVNNNEFTNNSYLANTTKFIFDNNNSIFFSTRRNKEISLTEYYNMAYQYKNDCLSASIEYSKDFYLDRDLKPEEGIYFRFTIIPDKKIN
jgi:LPS-assembly protein